MNKIIFILVIVFTIFPSLAADRSCSFSGCVTSPRVKTADKPGSYRSYNDLTKDSGGFNNIYADKILIRGIVVDKHCIPVANAKIRVWQRDEYGDYRYKKKFATPYEKYSANYKMFSSFKGHGTAVTSNTGKFIFQTVKPRTPKKKVFDNINLSVSSAEFASLESQILLVSAKSQMKSNSSGIVGHFNSLASRFFGQEVYDIYIVLDGANKYRKY